MVEAGPGNIITCNPGEVHDGMPIGGAREWTMLYLAPAVVATIVADIREGARADFEFTDPVVHEPTEVPRDRPEGDSDGRGNADDDQAHHEGDAGAPQYAGENVPAQLVKTEPVRQGRPLQPKRELLRGRIEEGEPGPDDGR